MTSYEEKEDLYLWGYRFRGTAADANDAQLWAMEHKLTREMNGFEYAMSWIVKHGTLPDVLETADLIQIAIIDQMKAAKQWVAQRSIPEAI